MPHSFLLSGKNNEKLDDYCRKICEENKIDPIDIQTIESEGSVGIEQVRILQKQIFLKPFRGKKKACIIKRADTLTVEAQNALLKLLEEPPEHTIIVLLTENHLSLLPTILSRCKVIEVSAPDKKLESDELSTFNFQLSTLIAGGLGTRLKLAQDVAKNKDELLLWLEKMIFLVRQELVASHFVSGNSDKNSELSTSQYVSLLKSFQRTHTILKTTNANPRLTLENLFLNI